MAVHVAQKEKELLEVTSPFGIWRHDTPRPVLHKLTLLLLPSRVDLAPLKFL